MQALLSFDQSPPLAAPLRFFLTAPLFAIAGGGVLLANGADGIASRWTPTVLALSHLIAVGFMSQVMLGAVLQILPVVAGANMNRPLRVAALVHGGLTLGTLFLAAAFLSFWPPLFVVAAALLGVALVYFIGVAAMAMHGLAASSTTLSGIRHAFAGLAVTLTLGVLMSAALGGLLGDSFELPLLQLADIHLVWGLGAWALPLLAAVAYVVVPMFQLTPAYPRWLEGRLARALLLTGGLWTVAELAGWRPLTALSAAMLLVLATAFCVSTLRIQRRSKRARFDATQHLWRFAMICGVLAATLSLLAMTAADVEQWPERPLLWGVLVLVGVFMSVIVGMLYKIVPFLIWLHLQNLGQGRVAAPNMKKIIGERAMNGQALAHVVSCALLLLAACWPATFVHAAGIALIVANGWLSRNLMGALGVHRAHLRLIGQGGGQTP